MRTASKRVLVLGFMLATGCQQGDSPTATTTAGRPRAAGSEPAAPLEASLPKSIPLPEIFGKPTSQPSVAVDAQSPDGVWTWPSPIDSSSEYVLRLKIDGQRATGMLSGRGQDSPLLEGQYLNGELSFSVVRERSSGGKYHAHYKGRCDGNVIRGTVDYRGGSKRDWQATRAKE